MSPLRPPHVRNQLLEMKARGGDITEGRLQIPPRALAHDALPPSAFGPWAADPAALAPAFAASGAVPHIVIDDFFSPEVAASLAAAFPTRDEALWHVYDNPLEQKRACSDMTQVPGPLRTAIFALSGPSMVEAVRQITGLASLDELQADPYCHGGGLHAHGRGGKLDLHLDYARHPLSGLERRFNLIVYLPRTPDGQPWDKSYGGALELRGADAVDASCPSGGPPSAAVLPLFNRALLFSTTAPSFHGFPAPLECPEDAERRSLALYYLTPPRTSAPRRSKALYVAAPDEADSPELERLRALRSVRRLEPEDLILNSAVSRDVR